MTAPRAAAFRSAWGLGDLCDRARRPAPSIARARQMLPANAGSGASDVWSCRAGYGPQGSRGLFPRCGRRSGIRNGSRPGSQAPHAPPALTFGLPGKQKVNRVQAGGDLICLVNSLPQIRKLLATERPQSARFQPAGVPTSARAFAPARSGRAGSRRIRCPGPSAPLDKARPWSDPARYWFRERSAPCPRR